MRNPSDPGWPERGERTMVEEVGERWRWSYQDLELGRITRRQLGYPDTGRKLGEATEAFLEHVYRVRTTNTYRSRNTAMVHLRDHFGTDARTTDITAERLQELWDEFLGEGYLASTVREYHGGVRAFFRWLGGLDPTEGIALPAVPEPDIEAWTDAELVRLRDAADYVDRKERAPGWPSARLMVETLLGTGARQQELYALEWQRFDVDKRTVRIVEQIDRDSPRNRLPLKGKKSRTAVVLPFFWDWYDPDATGLVLGRRDGRAMGYRQQINLITRVLSAARLGGPGIGYHRGRHTYARLFVEGRGSPNQLQKSLGHATLRTTERVYEHYAGEKAAEDAVAQIYAEEPRIRCIK